MELHIKQNATLTNVNSRIEHHGEDRVTAVDLSLNINDILAGELDQFALDGNMLSTILWNDDSEGDLAGGHKLGSPKLPLIKSPLTIDREFEKHKVVLMIESADKLDEKDRGAIVIMEAKIKKIKFTPKHHGVADLSLQVQGNLEGHEIGKIIAKYQGERLMVEIQPGVESQQTLLDESEDSEAA